MRMLDIIEKKKRGGILNREEIAFFVQGYTRDQVPDYQMAALLMAIWFRGLEDREVLDLTLEMAGSGETLDLSDIRGVVVDKHSTGGVGDKTSLVVAPMVASLGVPVAKMSGRGLGHTGGTIDKLEAIPGFSAALDKKAMVDTINRVHMAIAGQTANLAPADKKMYALRDVTGTVDQTGLIASSVMSKKIASGAQVIVLDVKTGSGAFMKREEDALELAARMVSIGKGLGRTTAALVTDMNQPLGEAVGNSLEVVEAIRTLQGKGPKDLYELCLALGSQMLLGAGRTGDPGEAKKLLQEAVASGAALATFKAFVEAQGGDGAYVDNPGLFPEARHVAEVPAPRSGYVQAIQTEEVGVSAMLLGGGRETKDSPIDLAVGLLVRKKVGDFVEQGEPLVRIHASGRERLEAVAARLTEAYTIGDAPVQRLQLVKKVLT
ncbi:pyrimidine-nucleoside phosphorylase [Anaerotalea alkaliphila]|uniref:Pyrimidine-nucleoside phosphorylase n=1 Tax=Anaerotalea alkaliphila TaxID=2662126 RepID=A0A7X5KL35_9FIRM|nr:pyrimidine-nucleoside phosphorylase [Anaerotalea alkaliphila]NDL66289.1 pyrimidine-nucleoside phosphorylase [Anaerotalea alkaliphila]